MKEDNDTGCYEHIALPWDANNSWCGVNVSCQFAFKGIDHVLANAKNEGRLVPCNKCMIRALEYMQEITVIDYHIESFTVRDALSFSLSVTAPTYEKKD